MKTLLATVLTAALAAAPVSAQGANLYFGPTIASLHYYAWENTGVGVYGGVSFDVRDYLRLGAFYVQRGNASGRVHSIEIPVLYKRRIADTHLVVGPAPSYGDYLDVGAMIGLTVRADRPVGLELAFVYGLVPDRYCCTHGSWSGHRVLRVGVEIPLRAGGQER